MMEPCTRDANNNAAYGTNAPLMHPISTFPRRTQQRAKRKTARHFGVSRVNELALLSLSVFETQRVKFISTRKAFTVSLCPRIGRDDTTELSFANNQCWSNLTWRANDPPQTAYSIASPRRKTETDAESLRTLLYFGDSRRGSIARMLTRAPVKPVKR